jgi:DNA-binding transcriptional LysR family regulator
LDDINLRTDPIGDKLPFSQLNVLFLEQSEGNMQDLNDLAYFEAVVRHGGFAAAARALGHPKSKLSRHVAGLEARLGVRLIERSTRRFVVTDLGREYYRHCQAVMAEAEAAAEVAARGRGEPRGVVRISMPFGLSMALAPQLPPFLARYPKLDVQLVITNRRVDLVGERIDIAVRVRNRLDTDAALTVRSFGRSTTMLVAAPSLVAAYGTPALVSDLQRFPAITHGEEPGEQTWQLFGPEGSEATHSFNPRLSCIDFHVLLQATIAGTGIALLPDEACSRAFKSGEIVRLLPDWHGGQGIKHLVFTSRRLMLPAVRATVDFLLDVLPEADLQPNSYL